MTTENFSRYVLTFDTANEVVAIGVGVLESATRTIEPVASCEVEARRQSNTCLLPQIDKLLSEQGIAHREIACVVCGRGPGSFTGVRIAMATAKGMASALEVPLCGVSSLEAVAWKAWQQGVRGDLLVVADAMRKEVYPVRFLLDEEGATRLDADTVEKAESAAARLRAKFVAGDALGKYADLFVSGDSCGTVLEQALWTPTGEGLLLATQAAWRTGTISPTDRLAHDPGKLLPVYTRLSDAEENERIRLSRNEPKNLETGVQHTGARHTGVQHTGVRQENTRRDRLPQECDIAILNARANEDGIVYRPLDAAYAAAAAQLESKLMQGDAWRKASFLDDLRRKDRVWWAAFRREDEEAEACGEAKAHKEGKLWHRFRRDAASSILVGYAGGRLLDGRFQLLKIAVRAEDQGRGIARELMARLASDARDLGATEMTLEVRVSNEKALALYRSIGLEDVGVYPRYYSDNKEDALIMTGPLPIVQRDVANMKLQVNEYANEYTNEYAERNVDGRAEGDGRTEGDGHAEGSGQTIRKPIILAIESSCDETAAAIIEGGGRLLSDVMASQVDFHARFGGVVPEIASRKHVEAICGVVQESFERAKKKIAASSAPSASSTPPTPSAPSASSTLPAPPIPPTLPASSVRHFSWRDLDAVAATYAPGLVGALVVGVAFAKAAAWALEIPYIQVNHLEGHLYAGKIVAPDLQPPLVASLVSGGHTLLVEMKDWGDYRVLGETLDDAVGEAFDKVAKALGLGYPGGPALSKQAEAGRADAIDFPRAMLHSGDLHFSLSGLKTAVITYIAEEDAAGRALSIPDIAASFQQAVIDVQVTKARRALQQTGAKEFCLGGGVAANKELRSAYERMCAEEGVRLTLPPLSACTDNAGMIALVALDHFAHNDFAPLSADVHAQAPLHSARSELCGNSAG